MNCYAKTNKGVDEMRSRSGNVDPKARRILILCNGQMSTDDIIGAVGQEAQRYISWLIQENYITNGKDEAPVARTSNFEQELVVLPSSRSAADFDKAKNFMVNTIGHFHGQYGHLTLKREIVDTKDYFELRALYAQWAESMVELKQFAKLKKDLFKVL